MSSSFVFLCDGARRSPWRSHRRRRGPAGSLRSARPMGSRSSATHAATSSTLAGVWRVPVLEDRQRLRRQPVESIDGRGHLAGSSWTRSRMVISGGTASAAGRALTARRRTPRRGSLRYRARRTSALECIHDHRVRVRHEGGEGSEIPGVATSTRAAIASSTGTPAAINDGLSWSKVNDRWQRDDRVQAAQVQTVSGSAVPLASKPTRRKPSTTAVSGPPTALKVPPISSLYIATVDALPTSFDIANQYAPSRSRTFVFERPRPGVVHVGVRLVIHHVMADLGGGGQALDLVGDRLADCLDMSAFRRQRLDVSESTARSLDQRGRGERPSPGRRKA